MAILKPLLGPLCGPLAREIGDGGRLPSRGPELVVNGDFSTASDWTLHATGTISGGVLNAASTPAFSALCRQTVTITARTYEVKLDVVSRTSGSLVVLLGNTQATTFPQNPGSYTVQITTTLANSLIQINTGSSGFSGSIDNISVKAVQ